MTVFEKSAIIGMYRCGASFELIADYFTTTAEVIERIVTDYLDNK